jgi:hypothetical protein
VSRLTSPPLRRPLPTCASADSTTANDVMRHPKGMLCVNRRKRVSGRPMERETQEACVDISYTLGQWMTSSARNSIDCGTVMPSALAVLRLMTISNRVGCSTGSSAG